MKNCRESERIQSYLDGDLESATVRRFETHLRECAACTEELAAYRRVFLSLTTPLLDPGPRFTERVLDHVVPARIRRRWVRTFGWSYAGVSAAFLAIAIVWIAQPGAQQSLGTASNVVSGHLTNLLILALESVALAARVVAGAWSLLSEAGGWLSPLVRVFSPLVSNPVLLGTVVAAAAACTAVIGGLRTRESRRNPEANRVAVLGF